MKLFMLGLMMTAFSVSAQEKTPSYHDSVPEPTLRNVSYGKHKRHNMDVWLTESDTPTPLAFVIHGGGWISGSKERSLHLYFDTKTLLENGISVVSINYRLIHMAGQVALPVKAPLYDAARALQFVRTKAKEWNINKSRIALVGSSAGGCSSLWLGMHDDLAEPTSNDPIARESTHVFCVAARNPQTSLDPKQMREWIPNISYGEHAFGISRKEKNSFEKAINKRDEFMPWIKEYSPYEQLTKGDPPIYLFYLQAPRPDDRGGAATHSANFGIHFQSRAQELGVKCEVVYPGAANKKHKSITDYLVKNLNSK
jgi:acetyl esterase/lipase